MNGEDSYGKHSTRSRTAWLGVATLLSASGVGVGAFVDLLDASLFCTRAVRGTNTDHGIALAILGGPAIAVLMVLARRRRPLLVGALLVGAAMLGLAVLLVASDRATYVCGRSFFDSAEQTSDHAAYLYILWGAAIGLLLLLAARPPRTARPAAGLASLSGSDTL
jgi:hypothetical protein